FSLGVVFYELLSGAWPYGDPSCVVSELRRAAAYSDPTPLDAAPTEDTASHRGLTRPALSRLLSGDLSAIAGKALENDPQRRYGTVEQFASDVRRYLDGRAVEARAQTAFYRSRKFVQRHWMPVLAAALFVIGLSTATAIAVQESRVARSHYEELRSLTASLLFELKDAINDVPGSTAAQKLLAARVVRTLDRMAAQTTSDPKLMLELAEAYRQFAELQASPFVQNLGDVAGARASLAKSQALVDPQIKAAPSDPAVLKTKALLERTIAEIGFVTGEEQSAVRHFLTADDIFDKLVAAPKPDISTLYEAAVTHQEAGDLFGQPGTPSLSDTQRAEKEYRRTIELDQVVLR